MRSGVRTAVIGLALTVDLVACSSGTGSSSSATVGERST